MITSRSLAHSGVSGQLPKQAIYGSVTSGNEANRGAEFHTSIAHPSQYYEQLARPSGLRCVQESGTETVHTGIRSIMCWANV